MNLIWYMGCFKIFRWMVVKFGFVAVEKLLENWGVIGWDLPWQLME